MKGHGPAPSGRPDEDFFLSSLLLSGHAKFNIRSLALFWKKYDDRNESESDDW